MSASKTTKPAKPNAEAPSSTEDDTDSAANEQLVTDGDLDIHKKLQALRLDEVVSLSQSARNLRTIKTGDSYAALVFTETGRYLRYVFECWYTLIFSLLFGGLGVFDMFSIAFFAIGGPVLMFIVLIFCLAARLPFLVRLYYAWAGKYGGGLGLVNSGNPNLFHALTQEQAEAAKKVLNSSVKESKDNNQQRFFNYDVAKFLLQLAAVIYEHENDAIREAVKLTAEDVPTSRVPTTSAAVAQLSTGLASLRHGPGALLSDLFSSSTSQKASELLTRSKGDQAIRDFCKRFDLQFEPVSEMNNTSSAFCGFFWETKGNWIVVAFKGTGPIEFGEWLSDFNAVMTTVGSHINGFTKVHKGFKERVFPQDVSDLANLRPYDTISLAVKTLAKSLAKEKPPGTKINVWVTGHSLGCATASLVYSRFLMQHKDMGKQSILRDAYLFAAPIVSDRTSVEVFNRKMLEDPKRPKTMWRITNHGDAVATCLPELGDLNDIAISPNNAFAFAHLGTEIKMRDQPQPCHITGNYIERGTPVVIVSQFTKEEIERHRAEQLAIPGEEKRVKIGLLLQKIPIIGRFIAHCTIYYWDQLDRVALGNCSWVFN